jgi:hypothetical protein
MDEEELDREDRKDLFLVIKVALAGLAVLILVVWLAIWISVSTCYKGSDNRCCDPSTPCVQYQR